MKISAFRFVCLLAFAGAAGLRIMSPPADRSDADVRQGARVSTLPAGPLPGTRVAVPDNQETVWKLAGLEPGATVSADDVLASAGLARRLRLGLFLTTATVEDLRSFLIRCGEDRIYDLKLTDPVYQRWVELDPRGAVAYSGPGGGAAVRRGGLGAGGFVCEQRASRERKPAIPVQAKPGGPPSPGKGSVSPVASALSAVNSAGAPSERMRAALSLTEISSAEEIRELLENQERFPADAAKSQAIAALLCRWLELEPGAALEWCRAHTPKDYPALLADYGLRNPDKAVARILTLDQAAQAQAWTELCEGLAARDPDAFWNLLGRLPDFANHHESPVERAIRRLAARDPAGVMDQIDTLPPSFIGPARRALAAELMRSDPAKGWEWVLRQPKSDHRLTQTALTALMGQNPGEALHLLSSLPENERSRVYFSQAILGPEQAAEFTASLEQNTALTPAEKSRLAGHVFYDLARVSPEHAAKLLAHLTGGQSKTNRLVYLQQQWRGKDPEAAEKWLTTLPEEERAAALAPPVNPHARFAEMNEDTPPETLAEAVKTGVYFYPHTLESLTLEQFSAMARAGEEARADGGERSSFHTEMMTANPRVFARWLEQGGTLPEAPWLAAEFSARWAHEEPREAAEWVDGLAPGELRTEAAGNVARSYAVFDRCGAAAWAESLADPAARGAAVKAVNER